MLQKPLLFGFLLITEPLYSPLTLILLKQAVIKLIYEAATVVARIHSGFLGSNVGKSEPAVEADLVFIPGQQIRRIPEDTSQDSNVVHLKQRHLRLFYPCFAPTTNFYR